MFPKVYVLDKARSIFYRDFMGTLNPPKFMFVQVNKRCNFHCTHCSYWKRNDDDKTGYLSEARMTELLQEYVELSPGAAIVICGGEPMLDPDLFYLITTECRRLGLRCLSVVNGSGVVSPASADRMIAEGPAEISISLDSHIESDNDNLRGLPGAFRIATTAVRQLIAARSRAPGSPTKIYVMGLICQRNWRDLDGFYNFVLNDLGADKLKINVVQPSFGGGNPDVFFDREHIRDAAGFEAVLTACAEKYELPMNPAWKSDVVMYVQSVLDNGDTARGWSSSRGTKRVICDSCERNIMVDIYGVASLCFSPVFTHRALKQRGDLQNFWFGMDETRKRMSTCTRYCGVSHSVRRESCLLKETSNVDGPRHS